MIEEANIQKIEASLTNNQNLWTECVHDLNDKLTCIRDLQGFMNVVYAKRQDLVDYHQKVLIDCAKLSRILKKQYADAYNSMKANSQIRYSTESAITAQVDAILKDEMYVSELYSGHIKFLLSTLKTVDDMIYGINSRIELEKLAKGIGGGIG